MQYYLSYVEVSALYSIVFTSGQIIRKLPFQRFEFFLGEDLFYTKKQIYKKNYIPILQNLYTHTMEMQHIIYMQEACGPPHIDHYRSKLCSLYTSNDQL